jgi:hypothetical protein
MSFCSQCRKTLWPFLFALFIAGVAAFLTWLTLLYSQLDTTTRLVFSGAMFVGASVILIHYMLSCMKRHCRHDNHRHAS